MGFGRVARVGVFGTFCAALAAGGSVGCGGPVSREWPSRRLAREYEPPVGRPDVMAPAVEAGAFTSPRLEGLPVGVQAAFAKEHPSAEVTKVDAVPSGTGPLLYRISFVEDGSAGRATYTSAGRDAAAPPAVVYRPDDRRPPEAEVRPAPEGGVPPRGTPGGAVD
jgi:hypothetical protein